MHPLGLAGNFPERGLMRIGGPPASPTRLATSMSQHGRQFVRFSLEADEPGPVSFDPERSLAAPRGKKDSGHMPCCGLCATLRSKPSLLRTVPKAPDAVSSVPAGTPNRPSSVWSAPHRWPGNVRTAAPRSRPPPGFASSARILSARRGPCQGARRRRLGSRRLRRTLRSTWLTEDPDLQGRPRGRAQAGHGAVRRPEGLDGAARRPRPRGGARLLDPVLESS